jgi:aryl-alcohol dehydrogenase-like predicted oxidoreductase
MVKIGSSDLDVTRLCLGGNVFGWTADRDTSFAVLDAYVAAGGNFVDTADSYFWRAPGNSGGESEALIGEWMDSRGNRDAVVVATKVGSWPARKGLSAKNIAEAVDDSLRRLRTDHIDLYYAHRDDPDTAQEETADAFDALVRAGKVRAIGASNYDAPRLAEALATSTRLGLPRYETLQPLYNLMERPAYEAELEPLVAREGLGVVNYYGLASGFLTGKYRSEADLGKSARGAAVKKYLNPRGMGILAALDDVAARHKATPAQIALAWLLARPSVTAPIASATTVAQLHEILKSTEIKLDAPSIAALDAASAPA